MSNQTPARRGLFDDHQAHIKPLGQRRLSEKSMSFHGRPIPAAPSPTYHSQHQHHHHQQQQQHQQQNHQPMRRLKTEPSELPSLATFRAMSASSLQGGGGGGGGKPQVIKLLLNVTIQGSVGTVQVVMSQQATVDELIGAAVRQYVKEGRRPVLEATGSTSGFDLHYSQFSLESLKREEKLANLGSRNFFLCRRSVAEDDGEGDGVKRCSKEAEKETKVGLPWLKFMNFLQ
ncbi:hypothetical protein AKJ16_DCAP20697 [Drosera capensis]